jgi:antitoxin (DNA-binding transcriptional repressor) of toxin-antitoxin stability system
MSRAMGGHSVAEAKTRPSGPIGRAPAGEEAVITRPGQPVVELRPVRPPARRVTAEDAGTLGSRRRDEDERW